MTTLVLVHGACHGSWCWEQLTPRLCKRGYEVVAPDLPCDDPSAGIEDYVDTVVSAIDPTDDLVVVGHSLGALTIPVVAARIEVSALVFLAGIIPLPGHALSDLEVLDPARDIDLGNGNTEFFDDGSFRFTEKGAMEALYHDCPEDTARWATKRLRRQFSLWQQPLPISQWPDTRMESIVCTEDRIVSRQWAENAARQRLGTEPVMFASGHSPMLSHPAMLTETLDELVRA